MIRVTLLATDEQAKVILPLLIGSVEDFQVEHVSLRDYDKTPVIAAGTDVQQQDTMRLNKTHVPVDFEPSTLVAAEIKTNRRGNRKGVSIRKRDDKGRTPDEVILDMFEAGKPRFIGVNKIRHELELNGFSPNNVYSVTKRLRDQGKLKRNNHNEFRLITNHPADKVENDKNIG